MQYWLLVLAPAALLIVVAIPTSGGNLSPADKALSPVVGGEIISRAEIVVNESVHGTQFVAECTLPTKRANYRMRAYRHKSASNSMEPLAIISSRGYSDENVLVRVHDQCLTSEVFGSERCDCRRQLKNSLDMINKEPSGGIVIYLQQEGRGIGLANKIAAYALQDTGLDTVEANLRLGLPPELREYSCIPDILRDLGISSIRLVTNNPYKVDQLQRLGVNITERFPIVVPASTHSQQYLQTKRDKMNHTLASNNESLKVASAQGCPLAVIRRFYLPRQGVPQQHHGAIMETTSSPVVKQLCGYVNSTCASAWNVDNVAQTLVTPNE